MRSRPLVSFLALMLLAGIAWGAGSDDIARQVDYEVRRLTAQNPMTRARATDALKRYAKDPAAAPYIAPALPKLAQLLNDDQPIVRWNAAVVLIRIGGEASAKAAYDRLEQDSRDPLYSTRLGVIDTLQDLGLTDRATSILRALAENDDDPEVRSAAQDALRTGAGAPQDEEAATVDMDVLTGSGDPAARIQEMETLLRSTAVPWSRDQYRDAVPRLVPLLKDPLRAIRRGAAVVVLRLGDEKSRDAAYDVLSREARDPDREARLTVAESLAGLGTDEAEALLQQMAASDPDAEIRDTVSAFLDQLRMRRQANFGGQPPFAFQPPVTNGTAESPEEDPQVLAARARDAVRRLPATDALQQLADLSRYREGFEVEQGTVPLSDVFTPAVPTLMALLRQNPPPSDMALRNAAKVLGLAGKDATAALIAALEDPLPETRAAATFALLWGATATDGSPIREVSHADVAGALVFSLTDEFAPVRAYAALALGKMGTLRYARDLLRALDDADPHVVAAAARALAELAGSDRAAPEYRAAVSAMEKALDASDEDVRALALETLGAMGVDQDANRIAPFVRSDSPKLTYAATAALVALGGRNVMSALQDARRDPRPWVQEAVRQAFRAFGAGGRGPGAWNPIAASAEPPSEPSAVARTVAGQVLAGAGWEYFSPSSMEVPLPGARIHVTGPKTESASTDETGRFTLANLPPGVYNLRIEADGYVPLEQVVPLDGGPSEGDDSEDAALTIKLHRYY